jgi:hypothetical protein
MSTLGTIPLKLGDDTYEASRLTQEFKDEFGRWCEAEAWKVLRHTGKKCDDREYGILLAQHQRMKRLQLFELDTTGSEARAYLQSPDGYVQFMFLALRKRQGVTPGQVRTLLEQYPEEFKLLFDEIWLSKKNCESPPELKPSPAESQSAT